MYTEVIIDEESAIALESKNFNLKFAAEVAINEGAEKTASGHGGLNIDINKGKSKSSIVNSMSTKKTVRIIGGLPSHYDMNTSGRLPLQFYSILKESLELNLFNSCMQRASVSGPRLLDSTLCQWRSKCPPYL